MIKKTVIETKERYDEYNNLIEKIVTTTTTTTVEEQEPNRITWSSPTTPYNPNNTITCSPDRKRGFK